MIIPDELSLSGILLGFIAVFFTNDILWWESLLGAALGGGIFLGVAILYEKASKQEGLGGGDIKLLAMIGAWLGYKSIPIIIVISSAVGSVVGLAFMFIRKRNLKTAIPFGPFLALAALIYLVWGFSLQQYFFPTD
jgi:leader peptidase (prepilin peptidase)/N-methyltransferase